MPSRRRIPSVRSLRPIVLAIARAHGVRRVRVFGSFARGQQTQRSDVDLLVRMPRRSSILDLVGLKLDLEAALRRKVDVVPEDSIKPALRERILAEARAL